MRFAFACCAPLLALAACSYKYPGDVGIDGSGGDDASDAEPGDGPAGPDAPTDAPSLPAFDVAYPMEWRFSVAGPVSGFILIVNTGPSPLSLSSFQISAISDDHPTATVRITSGIASSTVLQPDTAGGALSGLSQNLFIGSGLVMENWAERTSDFLSIEIQNAPAGDYDINVNLAISLDGKTVALPTIVHMVDAGGTIFADPLVGRRVQVFR
jgi:hypothetical protein